MVRVEIEFKVVGELLTFSQTYSLKDNYYFMKGLILITSVQRWSFITN